MCGEVNKEELCISVNVLDELFLALVFTEAAKFNLGKRLIPVKICLHFRRFYEYRSETLDLD